MYFDHEKNIFNLTLVFTNIETLNALCFIFMNYLGYLLAYNTGGVKWR